MAAKAPDFSILLAEVESGTPLREAEARAGYATGTVAQWEGRDLGLRLSKQKERLDAALKVQKRPKKKVVRVPNHAHHFFIGAQHNGKARGQCQTCGLVRTFLNTNLVDNDGWRASSSTTS